ncbi:MAG: RtcB family protein [Candidatus Diapherotrites archaeon]|nr:RtcB family protein [Candidatus Diapherotrites archaeon]
MGLEQKGDFVWEIPREGKMRVPARLYVDKGMVEELQREEQTNWSTLRQLKNIASLPGIQAPALALADCHPGYGAPIGSVAAMDLKEGVISFGCIGFDINCGLRTLATQLKKADVERKKKELAEELFRHIPAGLGVTGQLKLNESEIDEVLVKGAEFSIGKGYGLKEDLEFIEMNGKAEGAEPENVSLKAKQRQFKEVGTLGSGNHYLEVQFVEKIFDEGAAKAFGLFEGQILASIHCGSRALGHQIGSDYLVELKKASEKYNLELADPELVSAPIESEEGKKYFSAVNAGMNCAFANRQVLAHLTRESFAKVFGLAENEIRTFYEVGHNTAKIEEHKIEGKGKKLLVQRKGSTRGFGPGRKEVPEKYRAFGQPILVGGTMGTASYILAGTEKGMMETFGSGVHGAGRKMSRNAAIKSFNGEKITGDLNKKGIIIKTHSMKGVSEEAPQAYKDIDEVIEIMDATGISKKVARLRPMITVKG